MAGLFAPRFLLKPIFLDLRVTRSDFPSLDYYGLGPDSVRSAHTNYRMETGGIHFSIGAAPKRRLRFGMQGGYLLTNVGPGTDSGIPSTDALFGPATAPGIERQSNFFQVGPYLHFDSRDNPRGPRTGGNYSIGFSRYLDQPGRGHSFNRFDAEFQQFFSFTNQRRVIALRARTALTSGGNGETIPFYMQPALGGAYDLRGFPSLRFYDNNLIVLNGEYRWEVFSALDMAIFVDAGRVFPRWTRPSLDRLERSYGFGFRFNARNSVFTRFDFGFSREGFHIWWRFDNPF